MKVSYKWLTTHFERSFLGKKLPNPKKLAELLTSRAFEVESMEKAGFDTVFDIKVLPDRAHYALCHRGIAREIGAITGKKLARRVRRDAPVAQDVARVDVAVLNTKLCRRYSARRIDNISVSDSPGDTKQKLEAIGARAINSIVDITNFVMYDVGQPIHAFDADKVSGGIVVRSAKDGEKIVLLDGREAALAESDLVIADSAGPLAIAGVKGGKRAEVTEETRSIIVESANFDPVSVRRTSTRLDLRNDSSKRFENEITPFLAYEALDRVTKMVEEVCPKSKAGPITDVYPAPVREWSIDVRPERINEVLGVMMSAKEIARILESLDFRVTQDNNDGKESASLRVTPPLDRLDVHIEEEVADEVGRLYGYENIESKLLPDITPTPLDKAFYWSEKVKNILVSQGFSEVLLYTLVPKGVFEIAYPLASDKSALRESITFKLAESLVSNGRNADLLGLEAVKIFEIGKIFPKSGEKASLCIGVFQIKKKKGITSESVLKEAIADLERKLGLSLHAGISNGALGAIAEIDFDALLGKLPEAGNLEDLGFKALPADKKYKPFSPYPFIVRDVAFYAPDNIGEDAALSAVNEALGRDAKGLLAKEPEIFDRYSKDGKVSYAIRFILQSSEKTLSDIEANAISKAVYESIKSKGWEPR